MDIPEKKLHKTTTQQCVSVFKYKLVQGRRCSIQGGLYRRAPLHGALLLLVYLSRLHFRIAQHDSHGRENALLSCALRRFSEPALALLGQLLAWKSPRNPLHFGIIAGGRRRVLYIFIDKHSSSGISRSTTIVSCTFGVKTLSGMYTFGPRL